MRRAPTTPIYDIALYPRRRRYNGLPLTDFSCQPILSPTLFRYTRYFCFFVSLPFFCNHVEMPWLPFRLSQISVAPYPHRLLPSLSRITLFPGVADDASSVHNVHCHDDAPKSAGPQLAVAVFASPSAIPGLFSGRSWVPHSLLVALRGYRSNGVCRTVPGVKCELVHLCERRPPDALFILCSVPPSLPSSSLCSRTTMDEGAS